MNSSSAGEERQGLGFVEIRSNGRAVPMKPFLERLLGRMLMAMLSALRDALPTGPDDAVHITLHTRSADATDPDLRS